MNLLFLMFHPLCLCHGIVPGLWVIDSQLRELLWMIHDGLWVGILDVEINGGNDVYAGSELASGVDSSVFNDSLS